MKSDAPYATPLRLFFARAALLNGVLAQTDTHLAAREAQTKANVAAARRRGRPHLNRAWTLYLVSDLRRPTRDFVPVDSHEVEGQQLIPVLEQIRRINAGWTIAQGFEAFERFTFEMAAAYITDSPRCLERSEWRRGRPHVAAPADFRLSTIRRYVRQAYRGADDILPGLRALPDFRDTEQRNHRTVDFKDLFRVVSAVRHAIVHDEMLLTPRRLERLSPVLMPLLKIVCPGRLTRRGYVLKIRREDAQALLTLLGEYAWLIYVSCCTQAQRGIRPLAFARIKAHRQRRSSKEPAT